MKFSVLFSTALFCSFLFSCGDKNKDNQTASFSFDNQILKPSYQLNDTVRLQVLNIKSIAIDSVVYYINDKKINTQKQNIPFTFSLTQEKLGYQNIKGLVYTEGDNETIETRIEVVSSIIPKLITYSLLNTYPHDIEAYTQGLEFYRDTLIESTGLYEKSSLRKTNVKTGEVYKKVALDGQYFGEGITVFNNQIIQLTWKEKQGFIYDANTLKKIKTFGYHKNVEGWGLCHDGESIYFSDGTEKIWKLNPETLKETDYINVYTNNSKIKSVNELEYINGKIFANVYQKSAIAIIDPKTGAVEGIINLSDLEKKVTQHPQLDVLNGIAYNPKTNTIFVTGKNWDKMFEIKLNQ